MHPAIIIGTVRSLIVDVAMGQIPRSTERISSSYNKYNLIVQNVAAICNVVEYMSAFVMDNLMFRQLLNMLLFDHSA